MAVVLTLGTSIFTVAPAQVIEPASNEEEFDAGRYVWIEKHFVEPMKAAGAAPPEKVELYAELLRRTAMWNDRYWALGERERAHELMTRVDLETCPDPLVLTALSRQLASDVEKEKAYRAALRALELLDDSDYGILQKFYCYGWCAARAQRNNDFVTATKASDQAGEYLVRLIEEAEIPNGELPYFLRQWPSFPGDWRPASADRMYDELLALEGGNGFIKNWYLAAYENQTAWDARGQGFADTVPDEAWEIFYEFGRRAEAHMIKAFESAPEIPDAADFLIGVANSYGGQATHAPDHWFEKVTDIWPEHRDAHYKMLDALTPRWGGSYEEMFEFVEASTRDVAPESRLHALWLDAMGFLVIEMGYDLSILARDSELADQILELIDDIEARSTREIETLDRTTVPGRDRYEVLVNRVALMRTQRAAHGWWSQRFEVARRGVVAEDPGVHMQRFWRFYGINGAWLVGEVMICSGPLAPLGLEARQAVLERRYNDAEGILVRILNEELDRAELPESERLLTENSIRDLRQLINQARRTGILPGRVK